MYRKIYNLKKQILIYTGKGISVFCLLSLITQLKKIIDKENHTIALATPNFIKYQPWEDTTSLLIIPGGRSKPYYSSLGDQGNKKIIDYVYSGGNYLGICAGAYYASSITEFEKNYPLEIILKGPLNFFLGKAVGPAYGSGQFQYRSEAGARNAEIIWFGQKDLPSEIGRVYYNGGCLFPDADFSQQTRVLARYHDLEQQPPAIIECAFGAGHAILSGVHFEANPRIMRWDPFKNKQVYTNLVNDEIYQMNIFKKIVERFFIKNV